MPEFELYTGKASLYAAAFSWPVEEQATRIAEASNLESGRVLEPMCGHARLLRAFAAAGFKTVGVDLSSPLLSLAQREYRAMALEGEWLCADVRDFVLAVCCDLAVCPVNSLAHLQSPAAMRAHLNSLSRCLRDRSSYWVQLDLQSGGKIEVGESWEFTHEGEDYVCEWSLVAVDAPFETHQTRFLRDGAPVFAERHRMRRWTHADWVELLAVTDFELVEAFDGNTFESLPIDRALEDHHVCWQRLIRTS